MKNLIYRWNHPDFRSPRWMAFAFYSVMRNRCLYVAFPLNFLVALAWFIQDRWAIATNNPSWIEREVRRRVDAHEKLIRGRTYLN